MMGMPSGPTPVKLAFFHGEKLDQSWSETALQAFDSLEVTHGDRAPSVFQLQLMLEPRHAVVKKDFRLADEPYFKEFSRLGVQVLLGTEAFMLFDGLLTHIEYSPAIGQQPGSITLTGEDHSYLLSREDKQLRFEGQLKLSEVVATLLKALEEPGIEPLITPKTDVTPPSEGSGNTQKGNARDYLLQLARLAGCRFYLRPPETKPSEPGTAFFGPMDLQGEPQTELYVEADGHSNMEGLSFTFDTTKPVQVDGMADDEANPHGVPVKSEPSPDISLSKGRDPATWAKYGRVVQPRYRNVIAAQAEAQAQANETALQAVQAKGTLDTSRTPTLLWPGKTVTVRGVGQKFGGLYYVQEVKHRIRRGEYKQEFVLAREGLSPSEEGGGLL